MKTGPRHQAAGAPAPTRCPASRSPATPTPASPRCSTGSPAPGVLVENALFATLDPTVRRAETADGRRLHAGRHRRLRPAPAAPAGRGVPLDAGGGRRRRPDPARRRRLAPRPRGPDRRGARGARRGRRDRRARDHRHQQGRRRRPDGARPAAPPREALASSSRPAPAQGIDDAARPRSPTSCRGRDIEVDVLLPYDRGDLVSRIHEEGEVARERAHRATAPGVHGRVHADLAGELAAYAA